MNYRHAIVLFAITLLTCSGCKPPEVSITETPIKISSETVGHGDIVTKGDMIYVDYRLTLPSGKTVITAQNYSFKAGHGYVIRGIDEAVIGMQAGGVREFMCPPQRHWGRAGYGGKIPPATDLHIWLRVNSIEGRPYMRRGTATE